IASTMVSPSSVTTRRTVPCIAGCEGPRLTVIGADGRSCSSASGSCCTGSVPENPGDADVAPPARRSGSVISIRVHVLAADVSLAHGHARAAGTRPGSADEGGEIKLRHQHLALAQRV